MKNTYDENGRFERHSWYHTTPLFSRTGMRNTAIMKTKDTFYGRSKHIWDFRVVLGGFILLFLPHCTECCWGKEAPKFGDMTRDYNLMAGGELVLNCSLNSDQVEINKKIYSVNSSQLYLRKNGVNIDSSFVKVMDDLTTQMRMPNANISDSGIYLCQLSIPELVTDHLVCSSQVSVGYAPKPVKNFNCVSYYYENLTCTWEVEDSRVQTTYILFKRSYLFANYFNNLALQQCPNETMNNTYCQWRSDTDPPFEIYEKVFQFELQGKNSLGFVNQTFTLNHVEILLPKNPVSIVVGSVNKRNISIQWSPPNEIPGIQQPPLMYQMWLEELIGEKEIKVFDIGIDVTSYTIFDLEPYMLYNISLRCRSKFANSSHLWSSFVSVQTRTLPDVPYYVPEIVPEAFELRHYDGYRTVTLYWKPVSSKHYNGEGFTYHIVYSAKNLPTNNMVPTTKLINTNSSSATFTNLQENLSYSFHLYTLNNEGLSKTYKAIFVDNNDKIPEPPEDITAISYDVGHYRLSWKPPSKNAFSVVDYVVFWCSSSKPWLIRCESPIQWLSTPSLGNNVTLNLTDSSTNFQFAVVARTNTTSSGMQWATCIVPSKAALGKIENVIVDPKNSTSLKVMWRLDCSAQKAVVQKIEIDYCKTDKKRKCLGKKQSVVIFDSNLETYFIDNLVPFTNYSVILRAYNQAGVASEDSDPRFQTTLQGAPSGPPHNVTVVAAPGAALRISWQEPLQSNGIITHYILRYNNDVDIIEVNKDRKSNEIEINNLLMYTYYNITIKACVGHLCSPMSKPVIAQTEVGVPGSMDPPRVEMVNSTFTKVSWNQPLLPNGPVDFYEIQWQEVKNWNTSKKVDMQSEIVDKGLFTLIDMKCSNVEDGGIKYMFFIRAINVKAGNRLYGPFSESSQVQACILTQGLALLIGIAIGGTLALAFLMLMVYKLIKWMSEKIHQVKSITVCLPKGLDGPETNPLNNYENFKNGLLPQALNNNNIGRLSYIADDYDKNRHGSGSSQYSFSSTDELLYKTGKCTKFVRKPSGESSGCSSMSSNTTSKLQTSDSSTESDFMTLSSPDMTFAECNGLKGNLPTVMEAQDSSNYGSVLTEDSDNKLMNPEEKTTSIADGVVLKVDHPYSKFGVSNHAGTLPLLWTNPVTLYNNSLSNSEPFVADIKEPVAVFAPYSKVGLAKSSGDVLGLKQIDSDGGYSRYGIIATSKVDPQDSEFGRRLLPNKIKEKEAYSIKDFLEKYQGLDGNVRRNSDTVADGNFLHITPFMTDVDVPLETRLSEINVDNGYIKFRRPNSKPVFLKHGYVPFNELSNMSNLVSPSSSLSRDELQMVVGEHARISSNSDGDLQLDSVDLLPNHISPENDAYLTSSTDFITSTDIEVDGKPNLDNLSKELAGDNGGFTVNQLHVADNRMPLLKDAEGDPINLAQNLSHLETESPSMDLHTPENVNSANLRTLPQNGYVSFAELWNLHSETDSPMPKVKEKVKDTAVESTQFGFDANWGHNHIVRHSTDHNLPHGAKVNNGHEVHPMINGIPRCNFTSPHTEPQSFPIATCNGFSPQQLTNFGSMVESEICEV